MLPGRWIILAALVVSRPALAVAQTDSTTSYHAPRFAFGLGLGAPSGGGGVMAELRLAPRLWLRGVIRGDAGTVPRGVGPAVDLLAGREGRFTVSGGIGDLRCVGDRDGICSGAPMITARAWFLGAGGDFPVTQRGGVSVGVDVERWFSQSVEFASMFTSTFVVRFYF